MKHRKTVVTLSAICIALSLAGQSLAASPFLDINQSAAKDSIASLQEKGVVQGVSDGTFSPDTTMTAAQGIQLIVNALKLNIDTLNFVKAPTATDYFAKASNDAWYAKALIIAANNGLDLPADLDPMKAWTKEEFTHHLMHAIETHGNLPMIKIVPVAFSDEDQLTVSYQGSIQRALVLGIAKLDAANKFNPKSEISRGEAAILTSSALDYLAAHPGPAADKK